MYNCQTISNGPDLRLSLYILIPSDLIDSTAILAQVTASRYMVEK